MIVWPFFLTTLTMNTTTYISICGTGFMRMAEVCNVEVSWVGCDFIFLQMKAN